MQYRPDAATLLDAVADVLDEVLGDVPAAAQHRVRVAEHLVRLVAREVHLGADAAGDERRLLEGLLDEPIAGLDDANTRLAMRLREVELDHDAFDRSAWDVLVEVTRRDLDIAKPGHTDWTGT